MPIFPELRPYLEEARELGDPGAVYVIARYRDSNKNLRMRMMRIIRRAGLQPWPKLFQNLRATRETELTKEFPIHVVCAWIGNTEMIAAKHYLQVPDHYFESAAKGGAESGARAVQSPEQQAAAPNRTKSPETTEAQLSPGFPREHAAPCETV